MKFKLGLETVKAEDDGGVSLAINIPNLTPVVLSVEVHPFTPFHCAHKDKTEKTQTTIKRRYTIRARGTDLRRNVRSNMPRTTILKSQFSIPRGTHHIFYLTLCQLVFRHS